MSILSGFKKVKNYILTSSGYQLLSRWTSSQTVEFDDGKTAEEKVGDINGIAKTYVDIKNATDNSVVASATAVKEGLENSSALISMTQAEYDALSDAEKNDNNMRAITDANPDAADAKNVAFDNTGTGLSATNTQSAITEVNGKLLEYEVFNFENLSIIFPAKSIAYITQLTPHIPAGKSIVGFCGVSDCSDVYLTFGTSPSFGQYVIRGFNAVADSAVGITYLKAVLFYA